MIRIKTETHGHYDIAVYEVDIDEEMRNAALTFAQKIISSDNQYSRLQPENVHNADDVSKIEIQRTYMGKLGELVFLKLLESKGKTVDTNGMFEIYEGQDNVDLFDFKTAAGRTVDVKTGFRDFHTRLLVNIEQFDRRPKDYYVGVKIDAQDTDQDQKLVDWDDITTATVKGYAEYSYMLAHAGVRYFGEGPARWLQYSNLLAIDRLLRMF